MAIIGLGGSSLGTKAMIEALCSVEEQERFFFLDNVDSHTVDQWIESTQNFAEWGFIVCSKSGGTLEVLGLYDYCYTAVKKKHNVSII